MTATTIERAAAGAIRFVVMRDRLKMHSSCLSSFVLTDALKVTLSAFLFFVHRNMLVHANLNFLTYHFVYQVVLDETSEVGPRRLLCHPRYATAVCDDGTRTLR